MLWFVRPTTDCVDHLAWTESSRPDPGKQLQHFPNRTPSLLLEDRFHAFVPICLWIYIQHSESTHVLISGEIEQGAPCNPCTDLGHTKPTSSKLSKTSKMLRAPPGCRPTPLVDAPGSVVTTGCSRDELVEREEDRRPAIHTIVYCPPRASGLGYHRDVASTNQSRSVVR